MRTFNNLLVTGGAGFIGSNLIRTLLTQNEQQEKPLAKRIINLDKLTYAGHLQNVADVAQNSDRYIFEKADICDSKRVNQIFQKYDIDAVCHLAAESHVDRSISGPADFIDTNIIGTFTLLEAAREHWHLQSTKGEKKTNTLFHHVSTDEVFGSLGETGYFTETTAYDPRSPYSASKASSDHLVRSYFHTYDLPVTLTNCSNNYGPYQFPEKLIPVIIHNALAEKPLPVYGDGKNIRDWLYVVDHNLAVIQVMRNGKLGESYNIGGENEWQNIKLVTILCEIFATLKGKEKDYYKKLITFVKDRPGHDRRYAIDCTKLKKELNWKQSVTFEEGLQKTVRWYLENNLWCKTVTGLSQ